MLRCVDHDIYNVSLKIQLKIPLSSNNPPIFESHTTPCMREHGMSNFLYEEERDASNPPPSVAYIKTIVDIEPHMMRAKSFYISLQKPVEG